MYPKLFPFLLLICLSVLCACTKSENHTAPPQTDIVDEAKLFFESQVLTGKDGEGTPKPESIVKLPFAKSADWSKAITQDLAFGKTVVVPLKIDNIYVSSDKGKTKQLLQNNAYLILYKIDSKFKAEVLYKYPVGNDLKGKFTGDIIIQNWDGTVTKSFRYANGIGKKITTQFVSPDKPQTEGGVECVTNEYYSCTYAGNEENCTYNGSTTKCYLIEDGSTGGDGGGGYPEAGGGSGSGPTYPPVLAPGDKLAKTCFNYQNLSATGAFYATYMSGLRIENSKYFHNFPVTLFYLANSVRDVNFNSSPSEDYFGQGKSPYKYILDFLPGLIGTEITSKVTAEGKVWYFSPKAAAEVSALVSNLAGQFTAVQVIDAANPANPSTERTWYGIADAMIKSFIPGSSISRETPTRINGSTTSTAVYVKIN